MNNFLLEIYTEEIPFLLQTQLNIDIENLFKKEFSEKNLSFSEIKVYSTPKRMVVYIDGLPNKTQDLLAEKRGPKTSASQNAVNGFLQANNITVADCRVRNTPNGEFYYYITNTKGQKLEDFLSSFIPNNILSKITFKKSMKWNNSNIYWARPIRSLIALLNKKILNFNFAGINSSNFTFGHNFLSALKIEITSPQDYFKKLEENYVILNQEKRLELIKNSSKNLAKKDGSSILENNYLLKELAYLTEYPVVLEGKIPKKYMALPQELLINVIAKNQKYLNLLDSSNKLSSKFIIVANIFTKDNNKEIIQGNQKVLKARLDDALFFYNQDLNKTLQDLEVNINKIIFFEGLGTIAQKTQRVAKLFKTIFNEQNDTLCKLYKLDLASSTVVEISELQGIMGSYYTQRWCEELKCNENSMAISRAIKEHYKPQGPSDTLPSTPLGAKLSLLDKLDTLIEFFKIGKKPTGSKDPFALRRAALGIIRIIITYNLKIPLEKYLSAELQDFIKERLIILLQSENIPLDFVQSFVEKSEQNQRSLDISEMYADVQRMNDISSTENGKEVMQIYKRVANILQSNGVNNFVTKDIKPALLEDEVELNLFYSLTATTKIITSLSNDTDKIIALANLKKQIDTFFEKLSIVATKDKEIKENRLNLLQNIVLIIENNIPIMKYI